MKLSVDSAIISGELRENLLLEVEDHRVTSISEGRSDNHIEGTLLPGFVDIHCHGGGGSYFSETDPTAVRKIIATHQKFGTTSLMASLVTAPLDELRRQIAFLVPLVRNGELLGIHLEGPYLSSKKCGAHDPDLLRTPTIEEVADLISIGDGAVKMITIAPELPGAMEVISYLASVDVIAAVGHTNGTFDDGQLARTSGAHHVTHFYNAMPAIDHKNSSITLSTLLDSTTTLELILDGHHVLTPAVELVLKVARNRTLLVTDAMAALDMSDGEFKIGQLDVVVTSGVARLVSNNSLAGSLLTMASAFNRVRDQHGYSLAEASFATATLPARTVRAEGVGEIALGNMANFVMATAKGLSEGLRY